MFETIRTHNRWLMPLILGFSAITLVISGVVGFEKFFNAGAEPTVATVAGEPVTEREAEEAHRERVARMQRALGGRVDPRLFESDAMRAASLDGLLADKAMAQEAHDLHVTVSDDRLRDTISQVPEFQTEGRFDKAKYEQMLQAIGRTQRGFDAQVRSELVRRSIEAAIGGSAFLPHSVAARLRDLDRDRRTVRVRTFPAEKFLARAVVDEARIKAEYEAKKESFRSPESARVEYVVLRLADVSAALQIPEAEVRKAYETDIARFRTEEQRRASHILITFGKDGSAPDKEAARKLAEATLQEVKARPGEFARIARERSKDPISGANGGDLSWFSRADMVKPFSDAAFALKEGEFAPVVESQFGFHVIRVTGVRGGTARPFEEVRAAIEAEIRGNRAREAFAQEAEAFTDLVYNQPDSLQPAAERFHLEVKSIDGLTRKGLEDSDPRAALFTTSMLEALFLPDSLAHHRNTKAFDAGANALISARVVEYRPAATLAFDAVRPQIEARLRREAALQLAQQAGKESLATFPTRAEDANFDPPREISRKDTSVLPPAALEKVFALGADKLPGTVGAELPGQGYVVVRVLSASQAPLPDAQAIQAQENTLAQRAGSADLQDYINAVKKHQDVKILPKKAAAASDPGN